MALFKSQVISVASGSVGGLTYSRNRYGMYMRNRSLPVNPQTSFQVAVRSAMGTLTSRWVETLTAAERAAWETYAGAVQVLNKVGDAVFLTGLAMYVRCNMERAVRGTGVVDAAPTVYDLGSLSPLTFAVTAATGVVSVGFDNTDGWATADGGLLMVYASRDLSPSINFFAGPYRFAGVILGNTATPPTSPQNINLPFPVTAGNKVAFKAAGYFADGRRSSDFRGTDIAA